MRYKIKPTENKNTLDNTKKYSNNKLALNIILNIRKNELLKLKMQNNYFLFNQDVRVGQIKSLSLENEKLKQEIALFKEHRQKLKKHNKQIKNLKLEIQDLEKKIEELGTTPSMACAMNFVMAILFEMKKDQDIKKEDSVIKQLDNYEIELAKKKDQLLAYNKYDAAIEKYKEFSSIISEHKNLIEKNNIEINRLMSFNQYEDGLIIINQKLIDDINKDIKELEEFDINFDNKNNFMSLKQKRSLKIHLPRGSNLILQFVNQDRSISK